MIDAPVISIITPSYNQGNFLEETIVSVLTQKGDFSLDYLVIDGGSDDCSLEIIQRYADLVDNGEWPVHCLDIRFCWVSEKDRGQTDALMKGFNLAEGGILAWLNSDDVYLPGTLQAVANFFRENPETALLYGDAHYCDEAGTVIGRYPTQDFELAKLAYFNFVCQPSTFFRKSAFQAVGGLDEALHFAMDYDLFVRIGKKFDCRYVPQFFSKYRLHDTSKTMHDEDLFENHDEALRLALKHFDWAPLNRVYGACHYYCLSRLPKVLTNVRPFLIGTTIFCTLLRSLWLNRGLRRADLQLLNFNNFKRLTKTRIEILRG